VEASAAFASRRAALESAFNEIGTAFGAGELGIVTGGRGVSRLLDLAPPGIDELFGLMSVVEAAREYPLIVIDTAPTGHALRLLEMPDAAREWVQVLLRVLLKYRSLARPGALASELVELSKSIRKLHAILRNPREAGFVAVMRAAAMPRLETSRLLMRLRRLHVSVPAVIVNAMTLTPGRCPRCRATRTAERKELAKMGKMGKPAVGTRRRRSAARCVIIQTPLAAPAPRGVPALERWARSWTMKAHA
jgi:arsenite-transporting ATPase